MSPHLPLHPPIEPFAQGWLDRGDGHRLYFEQCGHPTGQPVLYLHGGPGSGCSVRHRRFFDPEHYRAILFDQRGCGRSQPRGETVHNHTGALISDIEALRAHLGISRWLVFGGSWGATLAACYASLHREACSGVLLRGLFLGGRADLDWFFTDVAALRPDAHQRFMQTLPVRWRRKPLGWLERVFSERDAARALTTALAWRDFETALDDPGAPPGPTWTAENPQAQALIDKYRIQVHYLARKCFVGEPGVLRAISRLQGLPVAFIHGRNDLVCRPHNARIAQRTLAGSRLAWAEGAGHDPFHPASLALIGSALACFARDGHFGAWGIG